MGEPAEEVVVDGFRYRRIDRIATRVSCWGMYDCHAFHKFHAETVDGVIAAWKDYCTNERDAKYGGPDGLCPVIVLEGDKELRRVGPMVHGLDDAKRLKEWRDACLADPDIPRLLASDSAGDGNG